MNSNSSQPTTERRVTRSGNAKSRPGLVDRPSSRRKPLEVTAAKEAKKTQREAIAKMKKKKEQTLAEIELQMKENKKQQRQLRQEHSKPKATRREKHMAEEEHAQDAAPGLLPASQLQAHSNGSKRKRTPMPEALTTEEETSKGEPPTPSPNGSRSSPLSECVSDDDQGAATEKTPKPPKKKVKSGISDVHSRDDVEKIPEEDAEYTEDEIESAEGSKQPRTGGSQSASTPCSSTATSQK
ncbi:hypothetical protein C8Q78DRAFT_1082316 [Trametes maxima]|nr:hypothetical protein C8Q78DRAFT_1082316 [Trametes maxima]